MTKSRNMRYELADDGDVWSDGPTPEQVELAFTDPEWYIRLTAVRCAKTLTPEQVEQAITDPDWYIRVTMVRYVKTLSLAQIERALADPDPRVRAAAECR